MIVIRTMSERDSSAVWELEKKCFSVPWSEESIRAMFSEKGYWNLTARDDGSLVGYIGMKAVLDEADITNVAVDPDRRRQGIGKMLLRELLAKAGDMGIRRIFLEVRVSNTAARALYEQAGFRTVDVRKNYYEKPKEDAYIMVWENGERS
ncbi:MAG TPA: ribosomal protein S18-alanine N-acetyltransferase [Candidatus Anaerobutyricum stercoripullorum]|uniref:[Ribosomal protein bS18]-alanine N-acetyltransferase n=1 Tax=Candidatus Anaerobutyricum stercoripullorum TaxID=2838456 RepID=A0A9D1X2R6_9FIRM|nr:ribosomal protein S18-alanine N-acetyltransferase [Candidatus Anaerobutyricum stercoripullorum]